MYLFVAECGGYQAGTQLVGPVRRGPRTRRRWRVLRYSLLLEVARRIEAVRSRGRMRLARAGVGTILPRHRDSLGRSPGIKGPNRRMHKRLRSRGGSAAVIPPGVGDREAGAADQRSLAEGFMGGGRRRARDDGGIVSRPQETQFAGQAVHLRPVSREDLVSAL